MKEGWKMVKLGEICETTAGGTPSKTHKEYYEGGKIPWMLSGEVCQKYIYEVEHYITSEGLENSSAKLFPINSVVVAMYGATAGQVGILKIETSTNQAVCGILPNDKMSPEFLYYYFLYYKDILVAQAVGNAQPNISQQKIKAVEIPLPPLEEQHRIVSILDAAFAKIDALKKNAEENLKNAKALFQQVLAQELKPKDGWVEKKLGEICKIKGGKRLPKGESISVEPTPYKYIRVADFRDNGTVIVDDVLYINETTYKQISQYTISSKDVYISIAGTIGKTGIIPEELEGANLTENACKLVLGNMINKRFLYYNTLSQYFKEQIKKGTKITAQPKLALNRLSEIIIPFPTDIDQQKTIVSTLDTLSEKCRRLEQIAQQTIRECDALKQSILRRAFSGEL